MSSTYPGLDADLDHFLSTRQRVLYVAFGTLIAISPERYEVMLRAFAAAYRAGILDGVVWSMVNTNMDVLPAELRESPSATDQTATPEEEHRAFPHADGMMHRLNDMLSGEHPFIRLIRRAPQRAVLDHPSVQLFLCHCGLSSMHEAVYAGKPLLCIPGYGDQVQNSHRMVNHRLGLQLEWEELSESVMLDRLRQLMDTRAVSAEIRSAVRRHRRLMRIANRQTSYAADLVEMAAIPGFVRMLESADKRMSWWRAQNLDVWAFFATAMLMSVWMVCRVVAHGSQLLRATQLHRRLLQRNKEKKKSE